MKKPIIFVALIFLFSSCSEEQHTSTDIKEDIPSFLPFTHIDLDESSDFREVPANWRIFGGVNAAVSMENALVNKEGKGILANNPNEQNKGHLFTNFEHGDMELELDVMLPKGSNSGLYFQGRYEVQLFDSWGVEDPQPADMGGIYSRWDESRGEGKEAFDGHAPLVNAAKAPGLWQHVKVIFHAPKFDASGKKIKNAEFEGVWLNGVLVQQNVEVSGPTRSAAFDDEQPKGPLMIQGDHGPVAIKHMKYKLYSGEKVQLADMTLREYDTDFIMASNLDGLKPIREIQADTVSAAMVTGNNAQKLLRYTGEMIIPEPGEYLFEYRINEGGGFLVIGNDTVVNLNGDYNLDSPGLGKIVLQAGEIPFQLVYNKHRSWRQGFSLYVEGQGVQRQALHALSSMDRARVKAEDQIKVRVADEVALQRGFWMHDGIKRTHVILVGTPSGINFAYDLANGALLEAWDGEFADVTEMWYGRGEKQLAKPSGFTVSFHGDPALINPTDANPQGLTHASGSKDLKFSGYTLDPDGIPTFSYLNGDMTIADKMKPSTDSRSLIRSTTFSGTTAISTKIAEGEQIEELPDGSYIVNDESYFIGYKRNSNYKPEIRTINGNEALVVTLPAGEHTLNYTITW